MAASLEVVVAGDENCVFIIVSNEIVPVHIIKYFLIAVSKKLLLLTLMVEVSVHIRVML